MSSRKELAHEIGLIAAHSCATNYNGNGYPSLEIGAEIAAAYIAASDNVMALSYRGDCATLFESITYRLFQWLRR